MTTYQLFRLSFLAVTSGSNETCARSLLAQEAPRGGFEVIVADGMSEDGTREILMRLIEEMLLVEKPDWVLVYGDTDSTICGALTAAKLQIPVAHVKAGLRSFNRRMPEEINRVVTDYLSSLLFCPTETAVRNLARESITEGVKLVGAGRFTELLVNNCKLLVSIDLSDAVDANLKNCAGKTPYVLVQGDINKSPLPFRYFDLVVCLGVIQHTPPPEQTIASLAKHLKPDGLLAIDHYRANSWVELASGYLSVAYPVSAVLKRLPRFGIEINDSTDGDLRSNPKASL